MPVRELQSVLNHVVPLSPNLLQDGVFGPKTRDRVLVFQKKAGLVADGIVGPRTGTALVISILDRTASNPFIAR
jgi:peptidoglycan hydrolase-like protein with peptidoglycan-binding domain